MFDIVPRETNQPVRRSDYFNKLFGGFFDEDVFTPLYQMQTCFRADLSEAEDSYIIEADLPGVDKKDISINYENNHLHITANREHFSKCANSNFIHRERCFGQLHRSFYVANVDTDNINAKFNDGVLTITLSKQSKVQQNTKTIPIH